MSFVDGKGLASAVSNALGHLATYVKFDSIGAIDNRRVRVKFDRPMKRDDALIDPDNYQIVATGGATVAVYVQSVEPQNVPTPSYVTLHVNEMTDTKEYELAVTNIIDPRGTPLDPSANTILFTGIGVRPELLYVAAIDLNTVEVKFTESMYDNIQIRDKARYSFDNGLIVESVAGLFGDFVILTTSEQIPGVLYTLTITQP